MGIKHCGKSTFGRYVAQKLGYHFFDIDDLIEDDPKAEGLAVHEIFKKKGQKVFKELEAGSVLKLVHEPPADKPMVIAPGGGIADNTEAMEALKKLGLTIFLRCHSYILYDRMTKKRIPAFLSQEAPFKDFLDIFIRRSAIYEEAADIIIEINDNRIEDSRKLILEKIKETI